MAALLPDIPQVELAIIARTNAFRAEQQLGSLQPSPALTAAARAYAAYLARTGKFAHEADGITHDARAKAHGYQACQSAENLARNGDSRSFASDQLARDIVDGWKGSPGHRRNMLLAHVTELGIGVARMPADIPTYVSVQLLARPQSLQFRYQIENRSDASVSYTVGGRDVTVDPRVTITHTTCVPDAITLRLPGKGWLEPDKQAPFVAKARDVFTIRRNGQGALEVDLQRR